jgi:CheY-like chemotaxis protein
MSSSESDVGPEVPTVLLVEDLEDDAFFFRLAIKRAGLNPTIHVAGDGLEAIDYFSNTGRFADATLYHQPDLVFLDLKMPNLNGFEVLEWIGQHYTNPPFRVVVLTGSEEPGDQARARELGASGYLVKPAPAKVLREFFREARPLTAAESQPVS